MLLGLFDKKVGFITSLMCSMGGLDFLRKENWDRN